MIHIVKKWLFLFRLFWIGLHQGESLRESMPFTTLVLDLSFLFFFFFSVFLECLNWVVVCRVLLPNWKDNYTVVDFSFLFFFFLSIFKPGLNRAWVIRLRQQNWKEHETFVILSLHLKFFSNSGSNLSVYQEISRYIWNITQP